VIKYSQVKAQEEINMKNIGIGAKVRVAIGKGRASGIVTEQKTDSALGAFYRVEVATASPQIKDYVRNNSLWVCAAEILKKRG
jgi:hypothetical protein